MFSIYLHFSKLFLIILFVNSLIVESKITSIKEEQKTNLFLNSISSLIFPKPMNISYGEDDNIVYLEKNCKFEFSQIEPHHTFTILKEILSIYDKILNKYSYPNQECKIKIKLKIENLEMIKYKDDHKTDYESYSLTLDNNSSKHNNLNIQINSIYLNGLIYGLETLTQILNLNHKSKRFEIPNIPIAINDKPAFGYRGVMIDTSRHFISVDKIKELLNGMMYSKLNVLHWHLTDDEYFTFKSSTSSYSYSANDISELINFAFTRGITIIPEIDNPSHTRSWKDIDSSIVITIPEYGTLDPSKNATYNIVQNILKEAIEIFSPQKGDFFHLGGDEVLSSMWSSEEIKKFMKDKNLTSISQLENYYFNKVRDLLPENKNYIYWVSDQVSQIFDVYNRNKSVLMYWGLLSNLTSYLDKFDDLDKFNKFGNSANNKRKIILTPGDYLYLDCGSGNKYGNVTWCGDYKTWKTIYNFPIFQNYKNFEVLGSQVVLFGELADENSFIGKIFPRACSLAERLWVGEENKITDIKNFFLRLINQNKRLKSRKISTISFTTQLCENKPSECIEKIYNPEIHSIIKTIINSVIN